MSTLTDALDKTAATTRFSGVVSVHGGDEEIGLAYGLANRSTGTEVTVDTRFGTASGSKGMTALVVASLVEQSVLTYDTPARDLLGDDLPLIDDAVTVEHLLSHRSGIGDYLDEDELEPEDYVMTRPVQEYLTTSDFLGDLDGHPQVFAPDSRSSYCNSGFVVLALLAERASGESYHDLVRRRVLEPAGMVESGFFRSDLLPSRTATGYLSARDDAISNVFHLPIVGSGDGGMYTTAADMRRFWLALMAGTIVSTAMVERMHTVRSLVPDFPGGYGLGFWLREDADARLMPTLQGEDPGVSFISRHAPDGITRTVLCNTTEGAWPMWETLLG